MNTTINKPKIIEQSDFYKLEHHKGVSIFTGCQCIKDCNCKEDYKPTEYEFYLVKRLGAKRKTTKHNTISDARLRIDFISKLNHVTT